MIETIVIVLVLLFITALGVLGFFKIKTKCTSIENNTSKEILSIIEQNENLAEGTLEALEALEKSLKGRLDSVEIANRAAKLAEENSILREKQQEYKRFFSIMLETVREDTLFMRSSLFKRLGSVDEYQDINHQIQAFQTRLDGIEATLREYRMIETYDDE